MGAWGAPKGAAKGAPKGGGYAPVQKSWLKPVVTIQSSSWSSPAKGSWSSPAKGASSWGAKGGNSYSAAPAWGAGKGGKNASKGATVFASGPAKGGSVFKGSDKGKGKGKFGKGKEKKGAPPADSEYWQVKMSHENREMLDGPFAGIIVSYNKKFGWGLIKPDNVEDLPVQAQEKIAEANQAAEAQGKEALSLLYFRRPDLADPQNEPQKDAAATFSIYVDVKGAGACEVTC
eukprot:TRINITY_DN62956_c0_g1_i1.p1 TRINITY_DN62956_c0_g1~~TRINITY_DN62956_c0_g1_i1.p1  ORF type:complete len:232 (+),score=53.77 TRINITY_DN62956_c0_g1_i1:49-744(+)